MGKYVVVPSGRFRKDIKKYLKKQRERDAIYEVIDLLVDGGNSSIPVSMKPHKLSGNYAGYWECHVLPDLLIIWGQTEQPDKEVYLVRIGSHSELF
ncbi:type II toxin-antitoxin system YafQ family toxin [Parapedobacter tibetensis]|uniref:type II toxin-antitoxin system YafQ family toxin n=1 Tax=Parapedobacter tibetensis TaxID=2972951 RepID=UPI00214D67A6|nr:type II toxin-antitoxin system YafQ family toxin [Parapedobacter tibetensis]